MSDVGTPIDRGGGGRARTIEKETFASEVKLRDGDGKGRGANIVHGLIARQNVAQSYCILLT